MTSEKLSQAQLLPTKAPSCLCGQSFSWSDVSSRVKVEPFRTIIAKYLLGIMIFAIK